MSTSSQSRFSLSFGAAIGFSLFALVAQANAAINVFPVNSFAQDTDSSSGLSVGSTLTVSDSELNTLFSLEHRWTYTPSTTIYMPNPGMPGPGTPMYMPSNNSHSGYFTTGANVEFLYTSSSSQPAYLAEGASIEAASLFNSATTSYFSGNSGTTNWNTTSYVSGYIGFRIEDGDSGNYNYGWLSLTVTYPWSSYGMPQNGNGYLKVDSYAIESELNKPITAGDLGTVAVPEPTTTAALLGLGAGALALIRRRKHTR
ncbi:MAG: PEP-CTERM sorting domain-containing protein [Verrucomicrobiota bacterium JB022]|nr:PEP-CTERM sorting domain-containing protein [Verrucomicrobiota bacterium JB022]